MGMKKYIDDYETILSLNEKGEQVRTYEYRGDFFTLPFNQSEMRKFKTFFLVLLGGVFLAHAAGGFMNNDGMRQFYVAIPYVLVFLPLFNLLRSGIRLPVEERSYQRDEIGVTYERFTNHSLFLLIALGLCLVGEVLFLLLYAGGQPTKFEYNFLAVELAALALGLVIYLTLKKIVITKASDEEKTSVVMDGG